MSRGPQPTSGPPLWRPPPERGSPCHVTPGRPLLRASTGLSRAGSTTARHRSRGDLPTGRVSPWTPPRLHSSECLAQWPGRQARPLSAPAGGRPALCVQRVRAVQTCSRRPAAASLVLDVQALGLALDAQGKRRKGVRDVEGRAGVDQHVVVRELQAEPFCATGRPGGDGEQLPAEPASVAPDALDGRSLRGRRARDAAKGDVAIAAGATLSTPRHAYLASGVRDVLRLHVVPLTLGGPRVFDDVGHLPEGCRLRASTRLQGVWVRGPLRHVRVVGAVCRAHEVGELADAHRLAEQLHSRGNPESTSSCSPAARSFGAKTVVAGTVADPLAEAARSARDTHRVGVCWDRTEQ